MVKNGQVRNSIKQKVVRALWGRAAGHCEICGDRLDSHVTGFGIQNLAEIAHNAAYSDGGPRANPELGVEDRNSIDNLLLLCPKCHKTVDDDPGHFPFESLVSRKEQVEAAIAEFAKGLAIQPTTACVLSLPVDGRTSSITKAEMNSALLKRGLYLDAQRPYDFAEGIDDEDVQRAAAGLRRMMAKFNMMYANPNTSISVFAIGPQSLLIQLGALLGSTRITHVFQRRRSGGWEWPEDGSRETFTLHEREGNEEACDAVAKFSLSGMPNGETLPAFSDDVPLFEMTVKEPRVDLVDCEATQDEFRLETTRLIDGIHERYPRVERVHIIPCMPVSLSVCLGMSLNFNLIGEYVLYEKEGGVYSKALTIRRDDAR